MNENERLARKLADSFRAEHGLGLAPIKDVFEIAHTAAGVDVLSMAAGQAEHGLSMLDPETGRYVIAVAITEHPMRQRSSAAHELGHILAGDLTSRRPFAPGQRTPAEVRADAFSRHLLLPLDAVRSRVAGPTVDRSDLSALVQEFEVSPALAAIQLREVGLIDRNTSTELFTLSTAALAAEHGWLSQYRSLAADSAQPRAPQALMARAVIGYQSGVLGLGELALWYGQTREDLEAELGLPAFEAPPTPDDDAPLFPAKFAAS